MGQRFGGMIQMYNAGKPYFWEDGWYPIKERLIEGGPKTDDDVLLVDIGGGDAGDLGILRKVLGPEVKGRLILQELKHIVDRAVQVGYEAQVGDWNMEQPVKGTLSTPLHLAFLYKLLTHKSTRCKSLHAPTHLTRLQQRRCMSQDPEEHPSGHDAWLL